MAFMVPVMQNDWDLYGTGRNSRRGSQQACSAPQSRRPSQVSGGLSRQTSASSAGGGGGGGGGFSRGSSFSSARVPPAPASRRASRAGSAGSSDSNSPPRCVTFGPPSPPCTSKTAGHQPEKQGFHTKVVDKLMRVLHRGEKDGARRC